MQRERERKRERELGYNMRDELQTEKLAIKPQLPNCDMQKRKELGPVYEKVKKDGKNPRLLWIGYSLIELNTQSHHREKLST